MRTDLMEAAGLITTCSIKGDHNGPYFHIRKASSNFFRQFIYFKVFSFTLHFQNYFFK